jgi:putative transcriptional regulator
MTTSKDVLEAIATGAGPRKLLVTLGYSAWGEGQLETELAENSWLAVPADAELLFSTPFDERWQGAAARIGVDLFRLTDYSGHV